ncbi:MAG: ATP-dependent Clp protease proteolytic subunit [Bacillota bacterium]|nr:ATP-dependent Clp protease proteolytic subunit [Bacillota bacterium]
MSFSDLFWWFLILSSLQPLVKQRMINARRMQVMRRIEANRGSRVIVLIHRQETLSLFGLPVFRYIDINDSEEVIRAIHLTDPDVPLDIVLHTPGGLVLAALQIACAIKKHRGKVTAFVPHYAMSGGTLIALAADEIVMDEHAVLGPVDPQLGKYPAASLLRVVKEKPIAEIDDETLILADVAEKATNQLQKTVIELLADHLERPKAEELARILSEGRWTHDYPLTATEAASLGLPVRTGMPVEFYRLMELYPQPMRRQPSVEYLPEPRFRERTPIPDRRGQGGNT